MDDIVVKLEDVCTSIKGQQLHDHICLEVPRGEILGLVGASGSGKSVLLQTILGLRRPKSGEIKIFGHDPYSDHDREEVRRRWGVLFQSGALFSSITVGENIRLPMREIAHIPKKLAKELTYLKLDLVGLPPEAEDKLPGELSGGMIKRAALARSLAIDAELLFLDEPTSGLDPISAREFDTLLKTLQHNLNLTVIMITHDLDSLLTVCDRVAVLIDHNLIVDTPQALKQHEHPWIQEYFQSGERSQEKIQQKEKETEQ